MISELIQMHAMQTYIPVDLESMTPQQKSEALNLLIFLTSNTLYWTLVPPSLGFYLAEHIQLLSLLLLNLKWCQNAV